MLSFVHNGNNFLIVEILSHELKVTLVKADFPKRTFSFLKSLSRPINETDYNYQNIADNLSKLVAKFGKLRKYKIILSLDPKLATTIYSGVSLVRDNGKDPIDEGDLDNLISKAIWGFFDRHRSRVAAKMGTQDLDVILSDVQVSGIKLDGHRVVNPIGFQAKSIELQLSLTFTVRDLINRLKNILPKENIIFVSEDGSAWSHLLSTISESDKFVLANIFPGEITFFSANGNALGYLDRLEWGKINLTNALMSQLDVDQSTAERIWHCYLVNNASSGFIKKLEGLISDELQFLVRGLEQALDRVGAKYLYINSFFTLPPIIFTNYFKNKFSRSVRLTHIHNELVSQKFNHELKLKEGFAYNAVTTLTGILIDALDARSENVNKMARRRIRWLI